MSLVVVLLPKYAKAEIERRWLVDLTHQPLLLQGLTYADITDHYIQGTRLRLRMMKIPDTPAVYKLCKKYGKISDVSEPITNLYLDEDEYKILVCLPSHQIQKRRYKRPEGGSVDIYPALVNVAIFEIEFASETDAQQYQPPAFVLKEVTRDDNYSGYTLANKITQILI